MRENRAKRSTYLLDVGNKSPSAPSSTRHSTPQHPLPYRIDSRRTSLVARFRVTVSLAGGPNYEPGYGTALRARRWILGARPARPVNAKFSIAEIVKDVMNAERTISFNYNLWASRNLLRSSLSLRTKQHSSRSVLI